MFCCGDRSTQFQVSVRETFCNRMSVVIKCRGVGEGEAALGLSLTALNFNFQ